MTEVDALIKPFVKVAVKGDIPTSAVRVAEAMPTVDIDSLIKKDEMPPRTLICFSHSVI